MINARQTPTQIFAIPAILAVLGIGGLIFALVEDGIWDVFSWIALSVPIALYVVYVVRGRRRSGGIASPDNRQHQYRRR